MSRLGDNEARDLAREKLLLAAKVVVLPPGMNAHQTTSGDLVFHCKISNSIQVLYDPLPHLLACIRAVEKSLQPQIPPGQWPSYMRGAVSSLAYLLLRIFPRYFVTTSNELPKIAFCLCFDQLDTAALADRRTPKTRRAISNDNVTCLLEEFSSEKKIWLESLLKEILMPTKAHLIAIFHKRFISSWQTALKSHPAKGNFGARLDAAQREASRIGIPELPIKLLALDRPYGLSATTLACAQAAWACGCRNFLTKGTLDGYLKQSRRWLAGRAHKEIEREIQELKPSLSQQTISEMLTQYFNVSSH